MKKEHKEIIIGAVAVVLIIASCFVSYDKFRTFNPIKGGIGFAKILIFDEDYAEVNDSPRVYSHKSRKQQGKIHRNH